jgi:hypothetical protein
MASDNKTTEDIADRIKRRQTEGLACLTEWLALREIEALRAEVAALRAERDRWMARAYSL